MTARFVSVPIVVDARTIAPVRQLVYEVRALADEMRVAADPYAERLEHSLARLERRVDDDSSDDEAPPA